MELLYFAEQFKLFVIILLENFIQLTHSHFLNITSLNKLPMQFTTSSISSSSKKLHATPNKGNLCILQNYKRTKWKYPELNFKLYEPHAQNVAVKLKSLENFRIGLTTLHFKWLQISVLFSSIILNRVSSKDVQSLSIFIIYIVYGCSEHKQ